MLNSVYIIQAQSVNRCFSFKNTFFLKLTPYLLTLSVVIQIKIVLQQFDIIVIISPFPNTSLSL